MPSGVPGEQEKGDEQKRLQPEHGWARPREQQRITPLSDLHEEGIKLLQSSGDQFVFESLHRTSNATPVSAGGRNEGDSPRSEQVVGEVLKTCGDLSTQECCEGYFSGSMASNVNGYPGRGSTVKWYVASGSRTVNVRVG